MRIDIDKCKGCGLCQEVCPLDVITIEDKKVKVGDGCVDCATCMKICPEGVFSLPIDNESPRCDACPVMCRIPAGGYGACKRYFNENGKIVRKARLHTYEEVLDIIGAGEDPVIERPLITGIGSGTTYPDFRPSPFIVMGIRDGVDVVTVVTEAPLSYSGVKLKVDTDLYMGQEGKKIYVRRKGRRHIGHLCTEEYGSKMLSLGGVNILTSRDGLFAAKTIFEILNGKTVKLEIEDGASIEVSLGRPPVVNGQVEQRMRVGCGSATTGLFAPYMYDAADEVIVLDGHITGLFTEHPSGRYLNKPRSGISIKGQKSTEGRYFLNKGNGWGGTDIENPLDVIKDMDTTKCNEGMTLLITETTGKNYAFYRLRQGEFKKEDPTPQALRFLETLKESCEPSNVSAILAAGVGGSARAGVTKNPIKLTRAVHEGKVRVTIGGAKPFIFPGGGINFLVDCGKIKSGSIYLAPTPSLIIPVEYTMTLETFKSIGGHIEAVKDVNNYVK